MRFQLSLWTAAIGWAVALAFAVATMTGTTTEVTIPVQPFGPRWLGYVLAYALLAMPFGGIGYVTWRLTRPLWRWYLRKVGSTRV